MSEKEETWAHLEFLLSQQDVMTDPIQTKLFTLILYTLVLIA